MTPSEAVKKLKGTLDDKRELFDLFMEKALVGQLEDWEAIMLETLKNELIPQKQIVEMSASMKGVGGARI